VLATVAAVAGCGGGAKRTQPAALKNRLLPPTEFASFKCHQPLPPLAVRIRARRAGVALPPTSPPCRLSLKRTFAWGNPIDYTVQGVPLPEAYSPSQAVDFIKKAGFDAATGEQFATSDRSVNFEVEAIKFRSAKGPRDVLVWLHARNLELPCYGSCTELPSNIAVSGIPGAKGAKQLPQPNLPPGGDQGFTAYAIEFPIGHFLYIVQAMGGPGSIQAKQVEDPARALYRRVSRLSSKA
jgi:hypothetical protein